MRALPDRQRRTTDLPWLPLFVMSTGAQVVLAVIAVSSGALSLKNLPDEATVAELISHDEAMPYTPASRFRRWAQAVSAFHISKAEMPAVLEAVGATMASAAGAGAVFVLLLANLPVHWVVYGFSFGGPVLLVILGALTLADDDFHQSFTVVEVASESAGGWPLIGAGAVWLLCTYLFWRQIRLGVCVLRCTSAFLRSRAWVGLYPFCFALVHMAGISLWACAVLGVGHAVSRQDDLDWKVYTSLVGGLILCFLWGSAFVTGLSTFAIAYITGGWYGRGPPASDYRGGPKQLVHAVAVGLRYHAGSIALGALLLALVRLLKIVLWWASKAEDEAVAAAERGMRPAGRGSTRRRRSPSLVRSARNFAADVLESAATWASKQAFVQVAISGCSFTQGARFAAHLAMNAPGGFAVVETLSNTFHRVCEMLLIAMSVVAAACCGFDGLEGLGPPALAAWLAAESLLHPYSVAATTLLHCCLLDRTDKSEAELPPPAQTLGKMLEGWEADEDDGSFVQHYA